MSGEMNWELTLIGFPFSTESATVTPVTKKLSATAEMSISDKELITFPFLDSW